jgi:hypothetical protein
VAMEDRERQFERALSRHLRGASPDAACPDADILAAYHERTLSLEEMAKWKEHIASCERCQQTLAIVEQTEPVGAEEWQEQDSIVAAKPLARQALTLRALGRGSEDEASLATAAATSSATPVAMRPARAQRKWIVPVGAVAAGVIVWIGAIEIRKQQRQQQGAVQIAENQRIAVPPAPPREVSEQKQAETTSQTRGDQTSAGAPVAREVAPPERTPASEPQSAQTERRVVPKAAAPAKPELQKKKDDGVGQGYGNVSGAPAPAPVPSLTARDSLARSRNEGVPAAGQDLRGVVGGVAGGRAQAPGSSEPAKAATVAPMANAPGPAADAKAAGLSRISGVVLDPSGAAIGGAMITAVDTSTGNSRTTGADATRQFRFAALPTHQYRVVVAHAGFAPSEQTLKLPPRSDEELEVHLRLGAVVESLEVSGAAAAVNTETADASGVKDKTSINTLPLNRKNYTALARLAASNPRYIVSPDQKLAWRVGDAGKIERSTDQGRSWKAQSSGVSVDLTAGSATSGKVCWLIGKAGTILLTTDGGKHWRRLSSPIAEDMGGIHAMDALHASVWDVANQRSFETADGGATWKPMANE